jgi:hypothetical protein
VELGCALLRDGRAPAVTHDAHWLGDDIEPLDRSPQRGSELPGPCQCRAVIRERDHGAHRRVIHPSRDAAKRERAEVLHEPHGLMFPQHRHDTIGGLG